MAQLPNLEVVAVNGVGADAVDLAYARDCVIRVTAAIAGKPGSHRSGGVRKGCVHLKSNVGASLLAIAMGQFQRCDATLPPS
jgi:hypothetical protein